MKEKTLTALDLNEREGATCFFSFSGPNASLALLRLLTCISNTICEGFVSVLNYIILSFRFGENGSAITTLLSVT